MAFDGGFVHCLTAELKDAVNCHIDKLYQPSSDELVFLLRKKDFAKRLLISARPGAARVQFTSGKYENPEQPPMFCMLARKHFSSARLTDIKQNGLERIIELCFEATNEMGDRVEPKIVCELIGNQSNIILVGADGRIIDAIRRSDIETAKRIIQPGAKYEYPPMLSKLDPIECDVKDIADNIILKSELPVSKAVIDTVNGFSPLVCREIAFALCEDDCLTGSVSREAVLNAVESVVTAMKSGGIPTMLYKADGTPAEFSYTDICQYGNLYSKKTFDSFSELLDAYYSEREAAERIKKSAADIIKLVNNLISRANKRKSARLSELESCKNREELRICGELIKANIHMIAPGSTSVTVQNFYDENLSDITVPLDPALNAAGNAARYFKEYKKSHTAEQTLTELVLQDELETEYLESVRESISRCRTTADISEIRDELSRGGYIRLMGRAKGNKKEKAPVIKEYLSSEGYKIAVGKNNLQNDYITTRMASKNDLWFHVKGIPGSHVVVFSGGGEVSDETLLFAARLAAENSKATNSSNVPVDYTPVRFVKKPNGAKPGMVIYTTNKTLFVTPKEDKE